MTIFGNALETIKSIRLTGGIFGKTVLLLIVLCLSMAAVSIDSSIWWNSLVLMLTVAALVYYLIKRCFDFAEKFPEAAIMEGAEFLAHERLVHAKKGDIPVPKQGETLDHAQPTLSSEEINKKDTLQPEIDAPKPNHEGIT